MTFLDFADLQKRSKRTKRTAVIAWAKSQRVPLMYDADGYPFTTLDALNRTLQPNPLVCCIQCKGCRAEGPLEATERGAQIKWNKRAASTSSAAP
jgi:hypothetical protein